MINLNGTVKFRNRKLIIYWTGEFAQHLTERNRDMPSTHPFLHLQTQKNLQICTEFKKAGKSYIASVVKDGNEIFVVFFIKSILLL